METNQTLIISTEQIKEKIHEKRQGTATIDTDRAQYPSHYNNYKKEIHKLKKRRIRWCHNKMKLKLNNGFKYFFRVKKK